MSDTATAAPSSAPTPAAPTPAATPAPASSSATAAPSVGSTNGVAAGVVRDPVTGRYTRPDGTPVPDPGVGGATLTQAEKRKLKFRANGEEIEIDEDRAAQELAISYGAKKKFTELDQREKAFEAARQKLLRPESFWQGVSELGLTDEQAHELAYGRLSGFVEEQNLTPEQKQLRHRQMELEAREAKIREAEEAREAQEQDRRTEATLRLLTKEVPARLDAAGLPKDGAIIAMVTQHLRDAEAAGMELSPETVARAVDLANEDLASNLVRIANTLSPEQAAKRFPDLARKLRQYDLEQLRARRGQVAAPPKQPESPPEPAKSKFLTPSEWRELQKKQGR